MTADSSGDPATPPTRLHPQIAKSGHATEGQDRCLCHHAMISHTQMDDRHEAAGTMNARHGLLELSRPSPAQSNACQVNDHWRLA